MVNQFYKAEILTEYVIRGNTAVLKCNIPSFVADYVSVEAWIADDGTQLVPSDQNYGTRCPRVDIANVRPFVQFQLSISFTRLKF